MNVEPAQPRESKSKKGLMIGISIAVFVIVIIIIVLIYVFSSKSADAKSPPITQTPLVIPPGFSEAPLNPTPLVSAPQYVARTYNETLGADATDPAQTFGTIPFRSLEESKRICDAINGCRGFARFRGNAYYRGATGTPYQWGADSNHPHDGSYTTTANVAVLPPLRRTYTFTAGQDATWSGKEDAIGIMPFKSADESKRICDAMDGCAAVVRYGGNAYYRPKLIATPTPWGGSHPLTQYPEDGSYVAS